MDVVTVANLVSVARPPRDRLARASTSSAANRLRRPSGARCDARRPRLTYAYRVGSFTPSRRAASLLSSIRGIRDSRDISDSGGIPDFGRIPDSGGIGGVGGIWVIGSPTSQQASHIELINVYTRAARGARWERPAAGRILRPTGRKRSRRHAYRRP